MYREPPEPDLRAPMAAAQVRQKEIERHLRAALARGEQPTTAMLAELLQVSGSLAVLSMEVYERAELLHARIVAAEHRIAAMLGPSRR